MSELLTDASVDEIDPITIGLVAHYVFCSRRAWLAAMGEETDTEQMAVGSAEHAATDDPRRGRSHVDRGVDVINEPRGYVGRCDTVERFDDGTVGVVEYKATPVRRRAEVTKPTAVQVVLQAAALEAMGQTVRETSVYFTQHKRRVLVPFGQEARAAAFTLLEAARVAVSSATAPPALEDDPRCARCSHISVCLPDERPLKPVRRRIVVADPDTQVVHLATPGSRASLRSGRLLVSQHHEEIASVPLERVQGVLVHGNVDLSGGLLRELMWRGLSVVWCTSNGRVVGYASSTSSPNGGPRAQQYAASAAGRLDFAVEFIGAKIANQATLLRRNGHATDVVPQLRTLARAAAAAPSVTHTFGVEGEASRLYFGSFATMLKVPGLGFTVRTRRPANDPVNAALNYCYALLLGDCIKALRSCGLDPYAGFLHSSNRNKPAMALDLCEEFRAPVADSAVVRAFNNGELSTGDFFSRLGSTSLTQSGRKSLIAAYERRAGGEFTHPTFGYRVTWRRAMEIQARMVLGVLDGTQDKYVGMRTR